MWHYVEIYADCHPNLSRNVEITGGHPFTPIMKVLLLLSWFSWSASTATFTLPNLINLWQGLVANNWFMDGYGLHLCVFVLILKELMKMRMSYGCTVDWQCLRANAEGTIYTLGQGNSGVWRQWETPLYSHLFILAREEPGTAGGQACSVTVVASTGYLFYFIYWFLNPAIVHVACFNFSTWKFYWPKTNTRPILLS